MADEKDIPADETVHDTDREPSPAAANADPDSPPAGKMILLARFPTDFEAKLAAAKLESAGLRFAGSVDPYSGIIGLSVKSPELYVQEIDLRAAVDELADTPARKFIAPELLADGENGVEATGASEDPDSFNEFDDDDSNTEFGPHAELCPHCHKHAGANNSFPFWACLVLSGFLLTRGGLGIGLFPIPLILGAYWLRRRWFTCMQCGKHFGLF